MKAYKWDFKTKHYNDYKVPPLATVYEQNMSKIIQCASCRNALKVGNGYTSRQIHNALGFGYIVCGDCYKKEWQEAEAADQEEARNERA